MEKRFVQYKRIGDSWPDKVRGSIDDMPERHWNRYMKIASERKKYELIKIIDLELKGAPTRTNTDILIVEDALECPLCGLVAESEGKLAHHKSEIHG